MHSGMLLGSVGLPRSFGDQHEQVVQGCRGFQPVLTGTNASMIRDFPRNFSDRSDLIRTGNRMMRVPDPGAGFSDSPGSGNCRFYGKFCPAQGMATCITNLFCGFV